MNQLRYWVAFPLLLSVLAGCISTAQVARNGASPTPLPSFAPTRTQLSCPVTVPNGSTPPGVSASEWLPGPTSHGNGSIWTRLGADGKTLMVPERDVKTDGSLETKFGWWRGVQGRLSIQGRRLDAPAAAMRAYIPDGYGDIGFQATLLNFPTEGCWEVTAHVGNASLTFVTLVVKAGEQK